jgi:hypothetical protein
MRILIAAIALASAFVSSTAVAAPPPRPLIGQDVALAVWSHAQNRSQCAPLALAWNGGLPGSPRMADFGAGWGVSFDTSRTRSVYGFAGTGSLMPQDAQSAAAKRKALANWPYQREVGRSGRLPRGSFAGYGLEGRGRYSMANPLGQGQRSLAYLRIPGQACLYNVWSKVSRAHLEKLLDNLQLVPNASRFAPAPGNPDFTAFIAHQPARGARKCTIINSRPLPCTLRRDSDGVLTVLIGGKEPLLVNVWPSRADLFAVFGSKNVPIAGHYVSHPGALDCIWAEEKDAPVKQVCVGVAEMSQRFPDQGGELYVPAE